ncbi:MAG: hypothetical protein IJ422_10505 [Oscillospiraceae bacterium]|nr:hypothetical protein [Oscillospiraceae bacterium]MBQ8622725.1 hypothetical protein [Oscillospiraceae bacterium]MBQ8835666.1 hypothetical protein [Oscillospiraceae bacterium]MBQ8835816.1 hypothetical protein [Oscillospiraceae bacterium]
MKVTLQKPKIITFLVTQEKTDSDYGSCLWARFYIDLENYTLCIESDCGNYSYGWKPTPTTESFLHLLSRLTSDYLIQKLASLSEVDGDTTWKNIEDAIKEAAVYEDIHLDLTTWEDVKEACYISHDGRDIMEAIKDALPADLWDTLDTDWLWGCVERDYSAQAKRIVTIFDTYIKPKVKELLEVEP